MSSLFIFSFIMHDRYFKDVLFRSKSPAKMDIEEKFTVLTTRMIHFFHYFISPREKAVISSACKRVLVIVYLVMFIKISATLLFFFYSFFPFISFKRIQIVLCQYCCMIGDFRNNLCEGYFSCQHLFHPGSFVNFYEIVSLKIEIIQLPSPRFSDIPEIIYTAVSFHCGIQIYFLI